MTWSRLLGIGIFILGVLGIYFGYQDASSDFNERTLDGYVDTSKWFMFVGAGGAIVGALMVMFTGPKEA